MTIGLFRNRQSRQPGITRVRTRWRNAANVAAARWEVFPDAEAEVRGFAFVAAPLKLQGATGSPIRPLALV